MTEKNTPQETTGNEKADETGGGAEEPRVGVYVCRCGGNISDVVDVEKVAQTLSKIPGVVVSKVETFMCSETGQGLITEDIKKHGLNRVVVASCTPSLHEMTFRGAVSRGGLNIYLYEHANIREQVSWCSKSDPEGATEKAIGLVKAAVSKARLLEPIEPIRVEAKLNVVVVGGGVAGLRCAYDIARAGLKVTLVEKSPRLGGRAGELGSIYPTEKDGEETVRSLIQKVENHSAITVLTSSEIEAVSGSVGDFKVEIACEGEAEKRKIAAGAIVITTGFDHYRPRKGEFGYEEFPQVITLPEFLGLLKEQKNGGGALVFNSKPIRNLAFIHCVGSRQVGGIDEPGEDGKLNEYCSRVCCTSILRAADEVRSRFPETNVFDFYRDIRTYGRGHETYYEKASEAGVLFFRFLPEEKPTVGRDGSSALKVTVKDKLTFGEEVEVPVDLVVLGTGMVPRPIDKLVEILKLPRSQDGFLQEVHPKLRPVEVAVDGVFIAGTCQAPMDMGESCASASAAAAKAVALLGKGVIELDPFVARVDPDKCTGAAKCVEVCVYQKAISLVEFEAGGETRRRAHVNPALCSGCGMCVGVCPSGAIQISGLRLDQFEALVDAIASEE